MPIIEKVPFTELFVHIGTITYLRKKQKGVRCSNLIRANEVIKLPRRNPLKFIYSDKVTKLEIKVLLSCDHGLQTSREEMAFTARPKIPSHSQIFRYGRSIFCLPHRPYFSDVVDLMLHWVSVVRGCDVTLCQQN